MHHQNKLSFFVNMALFGVNKNFVRNSEPLGAESDSYTKRYTFVFSQAGSQVANLFYPQVG